MAKYFTLSSPLSRCPYTFFSEDGDINHSFSPISVQTTRHFRKNNTLFSTKRHVGFFHRNLHRSKKILPLVTDCLPIIFPFLPILLFESANFSKKPSSRARVRARITGVFAFLLSQVSQKIHKSLYIKQLQLPSCIF